MKTFFTKYLPVEGEIKEGDYWLHPNGAIFPWTEAYAKGPIISLRPKKAKLFLCSRDIQVNDEVFHEMYEHTLLLKVNRFDEDAVMLERADGTSEYCTRLNPKDCYKVIGEISPDALGYVKEGQEFDEYQLWCKNVSVWGNHFVMIQPHALHEPRPTDKGWSDEQIRLKGPCGHFH